MKKGYIQIYTGNGKGKTTAAIGQAVRAAGTGLKTYIAQFMKEDFPYSERESLKKLSEFIKLDQFAGDAFVYKGEYPPRDEVDKAEKGIKIVLESMLSGDYDIIILDEVLVSVYFGLLTPDRVMDVLKNKPDGVELILTGRYCQPEFLNLADLVTIMKEEKHYYQKGISVRKGIES